MTSIATEEPLAPARLQHLSGVGPKLLDKLSRLGIHKPADLLFHLPYRYEDRTKINKIAKIRAGATYLVQGKILSSQINFGRKRSLIVHIGDGTGFLTLRFFYFSKHQQDAFTENSEIQCFGELRLGPKGLEMIHPEYRLVEESQIPLLEQHLTPIYPTVEGIQQKLIKKLLNQVIQQLRSGKLPLDELLPENICVNLGLPKLKQALLQIHHPEPGTNISALVDSKHPAQKRLIFEELIAHHLSLRKMREKAQSRAAPAFSQRSTLPDAFKNNLPFELTSAQLRVISEIFDDMSTSKPMLRLVQGDVGSGKTVVAMASALQAVEHGWQVALMAPTELLAEQHFNTFGAWANALGVKVGWLTGKVKGKQRLDTLSQLENGAIQILVGTHALFQNDVQYHKLGLIIIDEQHRFGVHQRLALMQKAKNTYSPHQLVMTATPIPRTLAMTAYADLDCSVIDELPKNRQPVDTVVLPETRRHDVIERIRQACLHGRQAYWVCPLIEESETLNCQAAENTAEVLTGLLPELKIGLIHGRLKADVKADTMRAFANAELDLLVATTVIEVGVDVPNASLMVIENAERLGLSQLHQLRGRIGRGQIKSSCVLMYQGKLSQNGRNRLQIMRDTNDGFVVAEHDLEIRGPGELLGTKQTGLLQLRVADISRDQYLLPSIAVSAEKLMKEYPDNIDPLIKRWLGQGLLYGQV